MKKTMFLCLILTVLSAAACDKETEDQTTETTYKMNITVNGKTMTAKMVDNTSTAALKDILTEGNLTYTANDYGGFEKVGAIGHTLPENNEQITTRPGDIILYQGGAICIYYDENTWNFTRLGKIDNASQDEIKTFLNAGGGEVSITLSLFNSSEKITTNKINK